MPRSPAAFVLLLFVVASALSIASFSEPPKTVPREKLGILLNLDSGREERRGGRTGESSHLQRNTWPY